MRPDTVKFIKAYLEVYFDFYHKYLNTAKKETDVLPEDSLESVKLFEIAWNDKILGEMLRAEVLRKYRELKQLEGDTQ